MSNTIPTYYYDENILGVDDDIFPPWIAEDLWVLFHGTSGNTAQIIESEGLVWSDSQYQKDDVARLVNIFDEIKWYGTSPGGYPVLKPFSLGHDFIKGEKKPIYLTEHSQRAITFALKDFAGGETARAIRYALRDLEEYFKLEEVREEHQQLLLDEIRLFNPSADISLIPHIDLDWLNNQLVSLRELHWRCQQPYDDHKYGVVYAIKFNRVDIEWLEKHKNMGIKAWKRIPVDRLIGKVIIPENIEFKRRPTPLRYIHRLNDPSGLLGCLKLEQK